MTSVLVVSRNTALGMWLSRNELDVDEASTRDDAGWPAEVPGHDVVLLDVGTVARAEQRLKAMVRVGLRVPVLLIGDAALEWDGLAGRFRSGLSLMRLPIQPDQVRAEITRLADGNYLDTVVSDPAVPPMDLDAARQGGLDLTVALPESTPVFDALAGQAEHSSHAAFPPRRTASATVAGVGDGAYPDRQP